MVEVADLDLLILADNAALNPADRNTAHIFIIIQTADQHLERCVQIHLRRGDILQNGFKQRLQIRPLDFGRIACGAVAAGAEQHRGIQLFVRGVQIHQQFQNLVHDLMNPLIRTVNLVDDDDHAVAELQRTAQDKTGLGHRAFRRVHQQNDAVDHLQNTFHLAAEVRMARGIDDVDLGIPVKDRGVLGKDGDAALTLQVIGVHHAVHNLLILTIDARLLQHFIHERGLAVVNVGNDGDVSKLVHWNPLLFYIRKGILTFLWSNCNRKAAIFRIKSQQKTPTADLIRADTVRAGSIGMEACIFKSKTETFLLTGAVSDGNITRVVRVLSYGVMPPLRLPFRPLPRRRTE